MEEPEFSQGVAGMCRGISYPRGGVAVVLVRGVIDHDRDVGWRDHPSPFCIDTKIGEPLRDDIAAK